MSSESTVPKTAYRVGINDPVQAARAELKAALAAIEQKSNLPRRAAEASSRKAEQARTFARSQPAVAATAAIGVAAAAGAAMWGLARLIAR